MKILLLGKDGQVGWELQRALSVLGELVCVDREDADFADPQSLRELMRRQRPNTVVNAAAYTAVDQAESDPDQARRVNAEAVGVLAEEAAQINSWLIHYSTDYVFDGGKDSPYTEEDIPRPLSVYGKTKLEGDRLIQQHLSRHLIFRTSWVYAVRGGNFAKTMLRLARERSELKVIDDQYGAPTSAELIADVTALALRQIWSTPEEGEKFAGLYHLTASGHTNWHGYARQVLEFAQRNGVTLKAGPEAVLPIPTEAYPLPASRPRNSRLDTGKLSDTFNVCLPDWRYHLQRLITELAAQDTP